MWFYATQVRKEKRNGEHRTIPLNQITDSIIQAKQMPNRTHIHQVTTPNQSRFMNIWIVKCIFCRSVFSTVLCVSIILHLLLTVCWMIISNKHTFVWVALLLCNALVCLHSERSRIKLFLHIDGFFFSFSYYIWSSSIDHLTQRVGMASGICFFQ